jgi:hypothetical protein
VLTELDERFIIDNKTFIEVNLKQLPGQKMYVTKERLGVADRLNV